MTSTQKYALDSNVFRNLKFIDYLILHKDELDIAFPKIVQLEVGYYFKTKGYNWEKFMIEMQKFNCRMLDWQMGDPELIINKAFDWKQQLPFKDHIRDYLIGTQCKNENRTLITYNVSHFSWIEKIEVIAPEDFVRRFERKGTQM
jgi:predicted nucleic acid-binding protein